MIQDAACQVKPQDANENTYPEGGLKSLDEINSFDVVRSEFLSPTFRPKITLNIDKLAFSSSCVRLIPDNSYVQMLFDQGKKRVVLLPCGQYDKDALKWSSSNGAKLNPKSITARLLCAKLFDFMQWEANNRYKVMAVYQVLEGRKLIVFNLLEYEMVVPEVVMDAKGNVKKKQRSYYPIDWRASFGTAFGDHRSTYEVNLDDYYLMSNKDGANESETTAGEAITGQVPTASDIITRQYYTPDEPVVHTANLNDDPDFTPAPDPQVDQSRPEEWSSTGGEHR